MDLLTSSFYRSCCWWHQLWICPYHIQLPMVCFIPYQMNCIQDNRKIPVITEMIHVGSRNSTLCLLSLLWHLYLWLFIIGVPSCHPEICSMHISAGQNLFSAVINELLPIHCARWLAFFVMTSWMTQKQGMVLVHWILLW